MKVSTEYWRCKPTHRAFIFRCTLKGHKWQAGPVQPYRLVACNPGLVFFLFPLPPAVQKIRGPVWQKCGKQHGNRTNYCHRYDIGLGINLDKYGERLFKLNQVFHAGFNSKGIGLYITKTQVESLGGTIEVKSKENEGSEFIVTL